MEYTAKVGESKNKTQINSSGDFYEQDIDPKQIDFHSDQARSGFDVDDLMVLAENIEKNGLINKIILYPKPAPEGAAKNEPVRFEVVSGERRLRAWAIKKKHTKIPSKICPNRKAAKKVAVFDNELRENIHIIDKGIGYKSLLTEGVYKNQSELAKELNFDRKTVSEAIRYADLPKAIRSKIVKNKISSRRLLRSLSTMVKDQRRQLDENKITEAVFKETIETTANAMVSNFLNNGTPNTETPPLPVSKRTVLTISVQNNGEILPPKVKFADLAEEQRIELKKQLLTIIKTDLAQ